MIRLTSAALLIMWFLAFTVAPATAMIQHSDNRLQHQPAPTCHAPVKPRPAISALTAKPSSPTVNASKPRYSKAQLAYVSQWTDDDKRSAKILKAVHKASAETGLSPRLIIAMIKTESSFDPKASGRGYHGLMQVKAKVHRKRMARLGVRNIYDVEQNTRLGADILVDYKKSAKGNLKKALVRYTGGSHRVANKILKDMQSVPT